MNKNQWLPWSQLMGFGFAKLQLSSSDFWLLTPREFDSAVELYLGFQHDYNAPSRNKVTELMRDFPDV